MAVAGLMSASQMKLVPVVRLAVSHLSHEPVISNVPHAMRASHWLRTKHHASPLIAQRVPETYAEDAHQTARSVMIATEATT